MKNHILAGCLSLASFLFCSCEKEGVTMYEESPTVYFGEVARTYTFVENMEHIQIGFDTIKIPLQISGSAVERVREVEMIVAPDDTLHTAPNDMFSIGKGSIEACQYKGYIPVRVNYSSALDDSVYRIRLQLTANKDFPGVDLLNRTFTLSLTNKITEPSNWSRIKSYFGPYSNSWYRFILETTGLTSIPYWSTNGSIDKSNPDPEKWTMTLYEVKAYAAMVKVALDNYNRKHLQNPLTHEDGPEKGKPVIMP
ncbi:DUF4843 domain-containing protein [Parabacteroides goldsteinii]|uniref:DUF4843 domain-containing protein n=1 Tax=Parabacteroides goldsteinii TaxID=328812 RepID=UPI002570DC9C|nr:DUF4843 domain-containing protein [Parabacteroides goldsteinii]